MNSNLTVIEKIQDLIKTGIIEGNLGKLYEALTPEFKQQVTITDLGKKIAEMEEHHGMFTKVGNGKAFQGPGEGEWTIDFEMKNEKVGVWSAHVVVTPEILIKELNFSKAASYVPPDYYNLRKVERIELQNDPKIIYTKPSLRKTNKLPIAAFIHATIGVNEDGKMGLCYPYKDFEYLSQKKIGLVRGGFKENLSFEEMANNWIHSASTIHESGGLFLIFHSFASLFLGTIMKHFGDKIIGIILINPAWEGMPNSGLPTINPSEIPHNKPYFIVGSGNDQLLTKCHFDKWIETIPEAESKWLPTTDHFLIESNSPYDNDYNIKEKHVNETILKEIANWIKQKCPVE